MTIHEYAVTVSQLIIDATTVGVTVNVTVLPVAQRIKKGNESRLKIQSKKLFAHDAKFLLSPVKDITHVINDNSSLLIVLFSKTVLFLEKENFDTTRHR